MKLNYKNKGYFIVYLLEMVCFFALPLSNMVSIFSPKKVMRIDLYLLICIIVQFLIIMVRLLHSYGHDYLLGWQEYQEERHVRTYIIGIVSVICYLAVSGILIYQIYKGGY